MENEEEMQKFVNLIDGVAEATGMKLEDLAPFQEPFVTKLKETLDGVEDLTDEDLISVGTAVFEEVLLAEESTTEETNNDNDNEQVEVIEPEEAVPDARTVTEIQAEIGEVLNGNPLTIAGLAKTIQCTKEFTGDIVSELINLGLINKVKKTLHWVGNDRSPVEEDDEEIRIPYDADPVEEEALQEELDEIAVELEQEEPPAETTNHAAEHAIEVAFATAKLDVLKVLDQQRKASESNPAYKAQAEQYTEVMNSLRAVFDRLQNGPEQYQLHNPVIQELARIAEWQPEA